MTDDFWMLTLVETADRRGNRNIQKCAVISGQFSVLSACALTTDN